tara:strand:- start:1124 stop:1600 length:477 start_codon:yes stop_codon:yes gene_type:complete
MATVYSDVRTDLTQDDPKEFVKANQLGGSVRVAYATYEASSLASGDIIQMFSLPQGARILDGYLYNDALGTSTTLSVGYAAYTNASGTSVSAAAAAYFAAASTSSAGRNAVVATLALGANSTVDISQTVIDSEFVVTATMGGAAGTGTIELMMRYVVD